MKAYNTPSLYLIRDIIKRKSVGKASGVVTVLGDARKLPIDILCIAAIITGFSDSSLMVVAQTKKRKELVLSRNTHAFELYFHLKDDEAIFSSVNVYKPMPRYPVILQAKQSST